VAKDILGTGEPFELKLTHLEAGVLLAMVQLAMAHYGNLDPGRADVASARLDAFPKSAFDSLTDKIATGCDELNQALNHVLDVYNLRH
jgi:hypothetical protein